MVDVANQDGPLLRRLLSTPGARGPTELVCGDVQSISRALLLLTTTAEKITFDTANKPPPAGSAAYVLWRGPEVGYAIDGFITMQYANMSAMDHARAFVSLIRTPTVRSTALATVARGSLESLARTWHLLARDTESDFIYRTISLLRSDLRYAELLGENIRTRDDDAVDPAARRRFYAEELERLQLPAPARVDLGRMVSAMLDAEMDKNDGRMRYSALSSIAHAHRLGINQFITTGSNGDINGMAAPRPVVMDIVGMLTAATYGTVQAFVAFYGNQTRHVELLEKAMQRAVRTLGPIMDGIWSES
ncbi:hypothetical protein KIV56_04545 [Cryobacterium breve]|uniref:Uncharacterized protein n=1 Tax=Cryobacterium breve TaxID=1259258 RepID=A0ABY7NDU0_9MICO|nr:hypothetical protein [Cryobacterium breve]WBM80672.1 hypothetical protein KIV56_04545 [Cryobacterium breve]